MDVTEMLKKASELGLGPAGIIPLITFVASAVGVIGKYSSSTKFDEIFMNPIERYSKGLINRILDMIAMFVVYLSWYLLLLIIPDRIIVLTIISLLILTLALVYGIIQDKKAGLSKRKPRTITVYIVFALFLVIISCIVYGFYGIYTDGQIDGTISLFEMMLTPSLLFISILLLIMIAYVSEYIIDFVTSFFIKKSASNYYILVDDDGKMTKYYIHYRYYGDSLLCTKNIDFDSKDIVYSFDIKNISSFHPVDDIKSIKK